MRQVVFLQSGPKKREPLVPAPVLRLVEGLGIEGDRRAKPGSTRQVLLMSEENCDAFGLAPGEVRENIVTRGLDPGLRAKIGGRRGGMLARVVKSGKIRVSDAIACLPKA